MGINGAHVGGWEDDGVLSIARQREVTRQDVQLLQAVADIAAIAINRTSLNEQTNRRSEEV